VNRLFLEWISRTETEERDRNEIVEEELKGMDNNKQIYCGKWLFFEVMM
jgi:hypothetical protein